MFFEEKTQNGTLHAIIWPPDLFSSNVVVLVVGLGRTAAVLTAEFLQVACGESLMKRRGNQQKTCAITTYNSFETITTKEKHSREFLPLCVAR